MSAQDYFAQAQSWAQDREAMRRRSARAAWIVAGVASGIAALEAMALITLAPLKTVVPYTLLVDRNTGYVQALEGTHPQAVKADSALRQALLAQYVIAREGYDRGTISEQFRKVSLWSAGAARGEYVALMQASNPDSPLNQHGRKLVVAQVESVSALGADQALVRFSTQRDGGMRAYWVAVLRYRFSGEAQALADRLVNPLGFQVIGYRRDQEAPPVAEPRPDPAPSAAPAVVRAAAGPRAAGARVIGGEP